MDHLPSILWLLSLPVIIYLAYKASEFSLKLFNKNNKSQEEAE